MMNRKVILISANGPFCRETAKALDAVPEYECVGVVENGEEAASRIPRVQPNVALVSSRLADGCGFQWTRTLKSLHPDLEVIMTFSAGEGDRLFDALRAGANGFLDESTPPDSMVHAIDAVLRGGIPMTREASRSLIEHFRPAKRRASFEEALSRREGEILNFLSQGYATKEIASELSVSYDTIRTHLKHIYGKLRVRSRTEAVIKHLSAA